MPIEHHQNNLEDDITLFAQTNFRNQMTKFGIKRDDRRRHMYLIGKTGMGKSNALENMVIADVIAGRGVCLIDPHGDAAEKVLNFIPTNRVNDVIYFNPADIDFPIAFNILETVDPTKKHLIASGLIGIFKKIWADSWGPRLEYLLRNAILALLDYQGSTLLGITRLLVNKAYRKKIIEKIQDPVVKAFWVDEYSKYPDRFQTEAIAPIQNKVGQFLSNSLIRNIVGQVKSTINMRDIMDKKKILIVNLSKGRVGEDTSALLGAMIITKIYLAAMSRVDITEERREDFYVYVDEFQNFATESFANILSEARKYRLNLIIAHQYIEQLDEKVTAAVFGNVGTIMTFRVGATDAEVLAKEFAPDLVEEDLVSLNKYNIYLRLMIDGVASDPFSATTLPPITEITNNHDKVVKISRERYTNSRLDIEEKISRWAQSEDATAKKKIENQPPSRPAGKFTGGAGGQQRANNQFRPFEKPLYDNKRSFSDKPPTVSPVKTVPHQVAAAATREASRQQRTVQPDKFKRTDDRFQSKRPNTQPHNSVRNKFQQPEAEVPLNNNIPDPKQKKEDEEDLKLHQLTQGKVVKF